MTLFWRYGYYNIRILWHYDVMILRHYIIVILPYYRWDHPSGDRSFGGCEWESISLSLSLSLSPFSISRLVSLSLSHSLSFSRLLSLSKVICLWRSMDIELICELSITVAGYEAPRLSVQMANTAFLTLTQAPLQPCEHLLTFFWHSCKLSLWPREHFLIFSLHFSSPSLIQAFRLSNDLQWISKMINACQYSSMICTDVQWLFGDCL